MARDVFELSHMMVMAGGFDFERNTTKSFKKALKQGGMRSAARSVDARPLGKLYMGGLAAVVGNMPVLAEVHATLQCEMGQVGPWIVRAGIERTWPEHADMASAVYQKVADVLPNQGDDAGTMLRHGRAFVDSCWSGVTPEAVPLAMAFVYQQMAVFAAQSEYFRSTGQFWFPNVPPGAE